MNKTCQKEWKISPGFRNVSKNPGEDLIFCSFTPNSLCLSFKKSMFLRGKNPPPPFFLTATTTAHNTQHTTHITQHTTHNTQNSDAILLLLSIGMHKPCTSHAQMDRLGWLKQRISYNSLFTGHTTV